MLSATLVDWLAFDNILSCCRLKLHFFELALALECRDIRVRPQRRGPKPNTLRVTTID